MSKNTRTISLSLRSQVKMALHATKHGYSSPIHGIVLGKSTDKQSLQIVDVVPVCHEVPTKPIVDMALRLADAHLSQLADGVKIIGWYTANASAPFVSKGGADGREDEAPNSSACRIVSSMAEGSAATEGEGDDFVLLLVSTSRLANAVAKEPCLPICTVFEKDRNCRTFTQRVDGERVTTEGSAAAAGGVLSKAVAQQLDMLEGGGGGSMEIYDFVDHMNDFGRGDWIENAGVNKLLAA